MTADQIVAFLRALGAEKIKIKDNGWVEARCPLAKWTHKNGHDHTPSFGINIVDEGRSFFSCFACQSGSAEELVQILETHTKGDWSHYNFPLCHQLLDAEPKVTPLPDYGQPAQGHTEFVEWPQYWLESFKPVVWSDNASNYLFNRGVTSEMCHTYDLRYDTKRGMVVFPYRDVFGRLAGARGRSMLPDVSGPKKHFDYTWQDHNNCRSVWYGEEVLNLPGPIVIVEGQFDCLQTRLAYPKVVANLTARPSWEKMRKLGDCPFIIQIPDRDEAGKMSMVKYVELCASLGLGYKAIWLDEGAKDPADCHPDYLRTKIEGLL